MCYVYLVTEEFRLVVGLAALDDASIHLLNLDVGDFLRTLSCHLSFMLKLQHLFTLVLTVTLGGHAAQLSLAASVHDFRKLKNVAAISATLAMRENMARTSWLFSAAWSRHPGGRSPGLLRVPCRDLLREPGF